MELPAAKKNGGRWAAVWESWFAEACSALIGDGGFGGGDVDTAALAVEEDIRFMVDSARINTFSP